MENRRSVERRLTVADSTDDVEFRTQHGDEPLEDNWMIIGQEYTDASRHRSNPQCQTDQLAGFLAKTPKKRLR